MAVTGTAITAETTYGYAMTLLELAKGAIRYLGFGVETVDVDVGGDSRDAFVEAKMWVNFACQELADFGLWPWLREVFQEVTLTANGYRFDLPEDAHRLLSGPEYDDSTFLFAPANIRQLKQLRNQSTTSGIPRVWAIGFDSTTNRHELLCWPPADEERTVNIAYTTILEKMTNEAGYPPVPNNLHPLILIGACAFGEELWKHNWNSAPRAQFRARTAAAYAKSSDVQNVPLPMTAHAHRAGTRLGLQRTERRNDITVVHG